MMKVILMLLGLAMLVVAMSSAAEPLSLDGFRVELEDGWEHQIEQASGADSGWGDKVRIQHPDGAGVLSMRAFSIPGPIDHERLRNFTNLPLTTPLTLERWGEYAGYQYDYVEGASFHRQWWLASESTVLVIAYQCDADLSDRETEPVNRMVESLSTATPLAPAA